MTARRSLYRLAHAVSPLFFPAVVGCAEEETVQRWRRARGEQEPVLGDGNLTVITFHPAWNANLVKLLITQAPGKLKREGHVTFTERRTKDLIQVIA